MAAVTAAIIGGAVAVKGMVDQKSAVKKQNSQIKKANAANAAVAEQNVLASEASVRAEALRAQQMELEGLRRRRDIIRQAQGARSLGLARANAQGALAGNASSVQAGQQQVNSTQRADVLANLQNIQIGRGLFAENKAIYEAQAQGATIQTQANNYMTSAQTYANRANSAQALFGAGMNIMGNAQTIGNVASTVRTGAYNLFGNGYTGSVSS